MAAEEVVATDEKSGNLVAGGMENDSVGKWALQKGKPLADQMEVWMV